MAANDRQLRFRHAQQKMPQEPISQDEIANKHLSLLFKSLKHLKHWFCFCLKRHPLAKTEERSEKQVHDHAKVSPMQTSI